MCGAAASLAAGAGIGLTPAGDDYLMGVLLAFWVGMMDPDPFIVALMGGTEGRTGRLSMAFLRAAARGEASQAWHRLAEAMSRCDTRGLEAAVTVLLRTGHSSGADALYGFTKALTTISSQREPIDRQLATNGRTGNVR
jgi:hypothetical protein